ncbi:hypothetical protein C9F11_08995 [Streptomyces sp. YIM 121038]|uniref:hypothetical protein n=1 Tax=Streptomyces sp. YIM 121038 TaxID=2136401 RepID=UPI001110AFE7|nr:hypothetical protein [Streptomyces sp. YIM 121038]QCX75488.1 hypothetical protein C9F11_08995 [Streptomyces sp. YIM 121038]
MDIRHTPAAGEAAGRRAAHALQAAAEGARVTGDEYASAWTRGFLERMPDAAALTDAALVVLHIMVGGLEEQGASPGLTAMQVAIEELEKARAVMVEGGP